MFSAFLPRGNHPFVYMSIDLVPNNVDVNVHPTKHEVHFLHEDEIVEEIRIAMEKKLFDCNETRELYTQQLLPGASDPLTSTPLNSSVNESSRIYAKDIIRSDAREQKLEKFFGQTTIICSQRLPQSQPSNSSSQESTESTDESRQASDFKSVKGTQIVPRTMRTNRK